MSRYETNIVCATARAVAEQKKACAILTWTPYSTLPITARRGTCVLVKAAIAKLILRKRRQRYGL
jgi:hypothetical protein